MTKIIGGKFPLVHQTGNSMLDNESLLQFGDRFEDCIDATDLLPCGSTYQSTPWTSDDGGTYAIVLQCVARPGSFV